MDAIELLSRLGQVEPADQPVLDAALRRFTESIGTTSTRPVSRRRGLLIAAAGAVAVAAAGAVVLPGVIGIRPSTQPRSTQPRSTPGQSTPAQSTPPPSGPVSVGAILTAFAASSNDILMVTKTMAGPEGTLGKTIIWIDPVGAGPGTAVQSRILSFTLAGARQLDVALRYPGSQSHPAACGEFFERPRIAVLQTAGQPVAGLRGTATIVYYSEHFWGRAAVAVQAATVPSADSLRACLRPGNWRDLGPGVLAGARTMEFAATAKVLVGGGTGYEHLWVDTATYLPVRLVTFNGAEKITFGFKFLPPTSANKALLRTRVPVGFVKHGL
jgi:hypothetical protein